MSASTLPDLRAVMERLLGLAEEVDESCTTSTGDLSPEDVAAALRQLEDAISRAVAEDIPRGLTQLSDQGLELIAELSAMAGEAGNVETAREVELTSIPFVLWTVRQGARIRVLAPVVNALAVQANAVRRPEELARMFRDMTEVVEAVMPEAQENAELDTGHPWRVLILNRAIVATRSHDPAMMEEAFDAIIDNLPGDALSFFQEAMSQMDAFGSPSPVREIVNGYYLRVAGRPTIH